MRFFICRYLSGKRISHLPVSAVVLHPFQSECSNKSDHGKAERKWKLWKEKEEKILRDSGVSEDMIEAIRLYDRQAFNSDRRYYERVQETGTYLDTVAASTDQAEPKTVQDFLDRIENQELYHILITVDRLTLQIVLMKIQGYSTHEIARYLKITEKAVYRRMDRLKEKIKKIF